MHKVYDLFPFILRFVAMDALTQPSDLGLDDDSGAVARCAMPVRDGTTATRPKATISTALLAGCGLGHFHHLLQGESERSDEWGLTSDDKGGRRPSGSSFTTKCFLYGVGSLR